MPYTKFIVMNTFSGRYLQERSNSNIGHENINFFCPSNCQIDGKDQYLLWLNCDGNLQKDLMNYDGNITLLMVTNFANEKDCFRVLAIAEKCHIINGVTTGSQKEEAKKSRFDAFNLQFPEANYGGKKLKDIFDENTYQGILDQTNTLATFYTEPQNVKVPCDINKTIRIKNDPTADIKQNMANEKMRMFITDENVSDVEEVIQHISWIPYDAEKGYLKYYPQCSDYYKEAETLFLATGNEKDELSVSNIISFSLSKSPELLGDLVDSLTGRGYSGTAEYSIAREDKHVDLTISLPDRTIIIENKIDSSIVEYNDSLDEFKERVISAFNEYKPAKEVPKRRDSLAKYKEKVLQYNTIKQVANEMLSDIEDAEKFSQLTKYYIQSKITARLNNQENKESYYFFLVPDYTINKFSINGDGNVEGSLYSNNYKLITYKQLKEIFERVNDYPYRNDILAEFELLSRDIDNKNQNWQIYTFLKKCGL